MLASAPQRNRSAKCAAALTAFHSEPLSFCGIFVEPDEIAHGDRKVSVLSGTERINSQHILETSNDNCKAERVETRVQKHEIVGERCQSLVLFLGDLLQLRNDIRPHGHCTDPHSELTSEALVIASRLAA